MSELKKVERINIEYWENIVWVTSKGESTDCSSIYRVGIIKVKYIPQDSLFKLSSYGVYAPEAEQTFSYVKFIK